MPQTLEFRLRAVRNNSPMVVDHSNQRQHFLKWNVDPALAAFDEAEVFEQSLTREISGHPDSIEAVRAVLERRAPAYLPAEQPADQATDQRTGQR